jgi:hypothetical protein
MRERHEGYEHQACEADTEAGRKLKLVLEDLLYEQRLRPHEAAARINISSERLYKYLNRNSGNNNLPAYLLPMWTRMIGPALLRYINHEAGCAMVELPELPPDIPEAIEACTAAMKECAEALASFAAAVADGIVTRRDLKEVKREVSDAVASLLALQMVAENMRRK